MARFEKGKSGNPNGRPKGAKNIVNGNVRAFISRLIEEHAATIAADFERLKPGERMKVFTSLLPYVISKATPPPDDGADVLASLMSYIERDTDTKTDQPASAKTDEERKDEARLRRVDEAYKEHGAMARAYMDYLNGMGRTSGNWGDLQIFLQRDPTDEELFAVQREMGTRIEARNHAAEIQ